MTHEVLPTIRKTGNFNVKQNDNPTLPSGVLEGAKLIFETAGIVGNQATLALDKIYRTYTGRSALKSGEMQLETPSQHQLLTPTEIGKKLGMSPRRVNVILEKIGFQEKTENGKWEPIALGKKYGVMLDVGKKHSDGTPVRQLKWDSEILEIMEKM